jgi:hypothetical protein
MVHTSNVIFDVTPKKELFPDLHVGNYELLHNNMGRGLRSIKRFTSGNSVLLTMP